MKQQKTPILCTCKQLAKFEVKLLKWEKQASSHGEDSSQLRRQINGMFIEKSHDSIEWRGEANKADMDRIWREEIADAAKIPDKWLDLIKYPMVY